MSSSQRRRGRFDVSLDNEMSKIDLATSGAMTDDGIAGEMMDNGISAMMEILSAQNFEASPLSTRQVKQLQEELAAQKTAGADKDQEIALLRTKVWRCLNLALPNSGSPEASGACRGFSGCILPLPNSGCLTDFTPKVDGFALKPGELTCGLSILMWPNRVGQR